MTDEHRHILDERTGALRLRLPGVRRCSSSGRRPASGHYRLVPTRRTRVYGVPTDLLDVPVGLAFFVQQDDGGVLAHYPSPLGATESSVDDATWAAIIRQEPAVFSMRPRVEALLVRTTGRPAGEQQWIVPIDECYRLVAVIKRHWSGMAGGSAVWREVARFFADLDGPAGRVRRAGPTTTIKQPEGAS